MEGGGECPGAYSLTAAPAAPPSAPPFSVESQMEPILVAEVPPPPAVEEKATEATSGVPDGGGMMEPPLNPPSVGTNATEVFEVGDDSPLPIILDEEKVASRFSDGGEGFREAAALPVLTDDLREKIVRQVEYYFSDENLPTDQFLLKFMKKDKEGFVPIAVIASFRRMKKLVQDDTLITAGLRTSSQLVVSADGKKVKRLHALPSTVMKDRKTFNPGTVLVENLPQGCTRENIQKHFVSFGNIRSISIHDPHNKGVSGNNNKQKIMYSSKVHALVEYETAEAAESAVATLNDQQNWRSGMRVELLLKRMEKFGIVPKVRKAPSEKGSDVNSSEPASDKTDVKPLGQHVENTESEEAKPPGDKVAPKVRSKRRGKSNQQHFINGHGHGHLPSGSVAEAPPKPPPGPRMPDGTRGFAMGRGKPCLPGSS